MKIHTKARCYRCRYPIPGNPFYADGHEFCSKSCSEFHIIDHIVRQSRFRTVRFRSPWYIVIAVLAMMMSMAVTDKAMSHGPYDSWKDGDGKSCCNNQDCAPAKARFQNGDWYAQSPHGWVKVPDTKILRKHSPDNDHHLCYNIHTKEVLCFVRAPSGM